MSTTGMQLPDSLPQISARGTIIAAHIDLRANPHAPQIQVDASQCEETVVDQQQLT
ncbi:hypothetical protein [Burkholderia contaminans]|uniref:hypothetical protein n=1 Tax=Burkholderia contaminans TaxID=488447 RepID=UPI0015830FA1|nr:hypothetical protein [Burkholderia contaminans]MCA8157165.1 hypothetical protein [Burkholderia contaminans]